MRQVPANSHAAASQAPHYLIIGDGRLARHLRTYFTLEHFKFSQWCRRDSQSHLALAIRQSTHVLLAIADSAIASFISEQPAVLERSCVHFSGALVLPQIPSAHPLMTFSRAPYSLETYRSVHFILEQGRSSLADLLPGLLNSFSAIDPSKKPLYHALCTMSGNFTTLLWEKVFAMFEERLDLPRAVLLPYLQQITKNLVGASPESSVLTGPLVRRDFATIEKHLQALAGDPYAGIYRAFVKAYFEPVRAETIMFPLGGPV